MASIVFVIALFVSSAVAGDADNTLSVPHDVMDFILDCQRTTAFKKPSAKVPFYETQVEPDSGTMSQQIRLLDIDQLRSSLKQSVKSQDVVEYVIDRISDGIKEDEDNPRSRTACQVEKKIVITVPPLELKEFNDQLTMVLQQNNNQLLEQFNMLLSEKLYNFKHEIEKIAKQKSKKVSQKFESLAKRLEESGLIEPLPVEYEDTEDLMLTTEEYDVTTLNPFGDEESDEQSNEDSHKYKESDKFGASDKFLSEKIDEKYVLKPTPIEDSLVKDILIAPVVDKEPINNKDSQNKNDNDDIVNSNQGRTKLEDNPVETGDGLVKGGDNYQKIPFAKIPEASLSNVNEEYRQPIVENLGRNTQDRRSQLFRRFFIKRRGLADTK